MMTLQQFRVLLAVREHGSLTAAAAALHYGVPTVKHHLKTLENYLQTNLVVSERSGTTLTPLGDFFADQVETVMEKIARAEQAVAQLREAGTVTLRIGTFSSLGSRLLPAAITRLQEEFEARVEIVEAEPTQVVRMLRAGELDAGIIYDTSDDPTFSAPDLYLKELLAEPYQIMVARGSELAKQAKLDFKDLLKSAWVCSREHDEATNRVLRRVYRSLGAEVRELMRTDDLYMIHGLVAEGQGLALTTAAAVDTDFDVELRPTKQALGERHVLFVTRAGEIPRATVKLGEIIADVSKLAML